MESNRFIYLISFCLIGIIFAKQYNPNEQDESIVQTESGFIRGIVTDSVRAFKGVPYAAPPVGSFRWAPTQPAPSWKPNILNTTQFPPSCPQHCILPPNTCPETTSEDCLYLNIYTPRYYHSTTLPVMVFIHGGHYEQGGAATLLYEGSFFANRSQTILVTVAYRLGALGYLTTDTIPGNYAVLDQRFALQWVQNNIQYFGGNPNQVTLFGQSAGAGSTAVHLISPLSKGLFSQAIIQSNPFTLPFKTMDDAVTLGNIFAKDIGCPNADVQCLMNKTVDEIITAQVAAEKYLTIFKPLEMFLPWTPTLDGIQFSMQPLNAFAAGQYQKMPMMLGCVSEEVLVFIYMAIHSPVTDAEYVAGITDIFLDEALQVLEYYPPNPVIGDKRPLLGVTGTDYVFFASTRNVSFSLGANSGQFNDDIYFYLFDHVLSFGPQAWGPNYTECYEHVCHGSELPLLFHTASIGGLNYTAAEEILSRSMIDYWSNFAYTGNPNSGPNSVSIQWPNIQPNTFQYLNFSTPNSVSSDWREEYLDFWNSIGYHWGW